MFRADKGEYGYIKKRKLQQLFLAILMALIGLAIYGVGYVVNDFHRNNICLILGILMVLPGAKFLTTYILLLPFHTPDKEEYGQMSEVVKDKGLFWSDLVITSTEHAMNLDYLYIGNGCVYGLLGRCKPDAKAINEYLSKGVRNWGSGYTVKILDNRDTFRKMLEAVSTKETNTSEEERVIAYLHSLIV